MAECLGSVGLSRPIAPCSLFGALLILVKPFSLSCGSKLTAVICGDDGNGVSENNLHHHHDGFTMGNEMTPIPKPGLFLCVDSFKKVGEQQP
jgi:hypothetical protein